MKISFRKQKQMALCGNFIPEGPEGAVNLQE